MGAEQLTAREAAALQASRTPAAGDHGSAGAAAKSAGAETPPAITTSSTPAAAPAGAEDAAGGVKARPQAGIDDAARAAGLTVGHIESTVEGLKQQVRMCWCAVLVHHAC